MQNTTSLTTLSGFPFGMIMSERSFSSEKFRYGFNGKENDNETGTQDYGMRIYNPSLGKFLSVDPISKDYPWLSTYHFASNTPIEAIDLDGLEGKQATIDPINGTQTLPTDQVNQKNQPIKLHLINGINTPNTTRPINPMPTPPPQAQFRQGGMLGSQEYLFAKGTTLALFRISEYAPITGDLHDIKDIATNIYKGNFVAASLNAIFLIPGADFLKPIKSLVKQDKQLLKFAKETFEGNKQLSKEATDLVDKYRKGLDGGIGGHPLTNVGVEGLRELRGKSGARVYFREGKDGVIEILGYSNKNNQTEVLERLKTVYGKKS